MDFHWWMLLPLIPLAGLAVVVFKVIRVRRRGRKLMELTREERLELAKLIIRDGGLPLGSRVLVGLATAYLAMPFDLIPDFLPIIGHGDDFVVITLILAIVDRSITQEQMEAAILRARRNSSNRRPATQP
ncbi:MAG: YkvA family protein [Dehalococcoidia bacterium]